MLNRQLPDPDFLAGGVWESIVSVPHPIAPGAKVRLVTDSGDTAFGGNVLKSYSQLFMLN